jgi:NAD(P)-dependent dehydrogenase (short-subunit alcohol dehydrogenase family)
MASAPRGTALVTGGARRIGRSLVRACALAGYDVAIHVRALDADAEAAADEVRAAGQLATIQVCDLGDQTAVSELIPACEAALGPLTLLVNSASLFEDDSLASMSRASWDDHMEVNLRTPVVLAQAFARQLPADRPGLIINLLDQRVLNPTADFFSYSLSKQALWSATKMLAQALAPQIRVNAIGPGPVLASIHQSAADFAAEAQSTLLRRPVDPTEIAQAMLYLIDAVSVTGQMIAVDGGQHLT